MRSAVAGILAALALVACGGAADRETGSAASLLKPGALVYWETVSDPDSDQWNQVEELLERFPDGDRWIQLLRREFEDETNVTWEEVREGLGERTVVAVYVPSADADPAVVGLVDPEDAEKTLEVVRKLNASSEPGDRVVSRVVDGWVVLSDTEASLDAALAADGAPTLADEETFTSGLEELPEESLTRAYFDVAGAVERFAPELQGEDREAFDMLGLDQIDFAGAWASAEEQGAKFAAVVTGSSLERAFGTNQTFSSKLLELVPADAFAFFAFRGEAATRQFDGLEENPLYRMGARQLERFLGVRLEELVQLFQGEVAFYARPAAPIPELTLLLDPENPEQARTSAERVLRAVAERAGGEVTEDGDVTTARFDELTVNLTSLDGLVVLSTSKRGLADLDAGGDKLPDSERFGDALEAAGVPDEYTALAYVDLREAIEVVMGFAESSDEELPPEVARNLEPLRSFVAFGDAGENEASVEAFLEIE